jgi:fructan beta-fructosidase
MAAIMATTAACAGSTIENFESGSLEQWVVEGEVFQQKASEGKSNPGVRGYRGDYYIGNKNNGTIMQGTLTSYSFPIDQSYINFLLGGSTSGDGYIELLIDGVGVRRSIPYGKDPGILRPRSWDVREFRGRKANIRIFARYDGDRRGTIMVDQIETGRRPRGTYFEEYKVSMTVSSKWLLIPAQDGGEASQLSVTDSSGENLLGVGQTVSPARERVDYYIPVDVSGHRGEQVGIVLTGVDKTDKVYGNITQSDEPGYDPEEPFRQLYHFTPAFGWTNDPNGMVFHDGEYHLAFQSNPYGTRHANMHWGNAVSKDLVHWENLPFIIAPDPQGAIFSGSAVVDSHNTAGFGRDAIVAVYTSAGGVNYSRQQQHLAYSLDRGRTYTKYDGNPVLFDGDLQPDFRDPKVMWTGSGWLRALATGQTITFYGSDNLREWEKLSDFGYGIGSHDGVWECPDLLKMSYRGREKWALLVSINPGSPHGGSITQYFIGNFDGTTFTADPGEYPLWLDAGADNYAGVTFYGTGERRLFMGWMSNWLYSNDTPTTNFRNSMTSPRELFLKHDGEKLILASRPSPEVRDAFEHAENVEPVEVDGGAQTRDGLPDSGACRLEMTLTPGGEGSFGFSLENGRGEAALFTFDTADGTLSLDRSHSGLVGFNAEFARRPVTTPIVRKESYRIELLVDRMSTELFLGEGDLVFTNTLFPTESYDRIRFFSEGCSMRATDIGVYKLKTE